MELNSNYAYACSTGSRITGGGQGWADNARQVAQNIAYSHHVTLSSFSVDTSVGGYNQITAVFCGGADDAAAAASDF